jgi:hypothetical protein
MKFLFIAVSALLSFHIQAQIVSRDSVVGTWVCTEVTLMPTKDMSDPKLKSSLEIMKKAYLGSTFTFGADGIFRHTLVKPGPEFVQMLRILNGKKWYFDTPGNSISIGQPSENLMKIDVVEANNSTYFVPDTPIWLKVERRPTP